MAAQVAWAAALARIQVPAAIAAELTAEVQNRKAGWSWVDGL